MRLVILPHPGMKRTTLSELVVPLDLVPPPPSALEEVQDHLCEGRVVKIPSGNV